jgi:hypothetical protein
MQVTEAIAVPIKSPCAKIFSLKQAGFRHVKPGILRRSHIGKFLFAYSFRAVTVHSGSQITETRINRLSRGCKLLLPMTAKCAIISWIRSRHAKTLRAIFALPTQASILFSDMESLVKALGAKIVEREGSRVIFDFGDDVWHTHRPHPGKDARKYQVESLRDFLKRRGITP